MLNFITKFLGAFGIIGTLVAIILWVLIIFGWIKNIINVFIMALNYSDFAGVAVDMALILKISFQVIGVFYVPLGAIMGFIV